MSLDPKKSGWQRCPMSGEEQMLAWPPSDDGYPGAVVCLECCFGVMIKPGSHHEATSEAGNQGLAGKVRVHHVKYRTDPLRVGRSDARQLDEMRYPKERRKPDGQ